MSLASSATSPKANHFIPTTTRFRQARTLTLSVNTVIETIFVKKNVP